MPSYTNVTKRYKAPRGDALRKGDIVYLDCDAEDLYFIVDVLGTHGPVWAEGDKAVLLPLNAEGATFLFTSCSTNPQYYRLADHIDEVNIVFAQDPT